MSSIYTNGNDSYFYSNKIKVFPCAYRSNAYDATARLNTEHNFTHLPHMVDKASYIIKFNDIPENETTTKLICVIQGYYFEIELGDDDYATLQNKYLNICLASPNGAGSIESPHLCSWDSSDSVEATLDGKPEGSNYYIFKGLKIGEGALSNGSYQCYALKLDASAKLPIMANKIEDSAEANAGVPISSKFTTGTLSATTSISTPELSVASNTLIAKSDGITVNVPVTINNTLDVKTGDTSVLKAESTKVTINKPTDITGTTEIKKSSSGATDGNLKVAGTGNFGGKLTVQNGGADITGSTQISKSSSKATDGNLTVAGTVGITGKTTIGTDSAKTEIENNKITTSEIIADKINIEKASGTGSLVINKNQDKIIEIKNKSGTLIFSVDTDSGETWASKINAPVKGTSNDAVNVKASINGKSITDIFENNGFVARKASSITATSSNNSVGNTIITGNTTDKIDALIPEKATGRTYNIGSIAKTFDNIYATTFHGSLAGNANTATSADSATYAASAGSANTATSATYADSFSSGTTVELTGNITGESSSSTKGWTIETTINKGVVTNDMLAGGIANDKLAGGITNSKLQNKGIKIAGSEVLLGNSIGTANNDRIDKTLYGTSLNLSDDMLVNSIENIKVNNASLKSSTALQIVKSNNYDYVKISNGSSTINSLLVNGLSEFTSRAKFEAGIGVTGSATFGNGISVTQDTATFGAGISVTGTAEATTFNAKSDKRLKENIIDYKPEKSILDLPIKKFDFIDGPKNQIGCIAQDLKEICPEIVNENEKGYLSIQESKLVYLLLDEVKKLKNEVEKLKRK